MGGEWYFKDRAGKTQGPFGSEEMRAWYEVGYLAPDLLVARGDPRSNQFLQLQQHFPNGRTAFLDEFPSAIESSGGQWYFLDSSHKQQGPFTDIHMRQWHMAGYFEPTLMVIDMNVPNPKWAQLRAFFPNTADAFLGAATPQTRPAAGSQMGGRAQGSQAAAGGRPQGSQGGAGGGRDPRFNFPEWMPVPPRYRGVKKVYPSEKNGAKRMPAMRDVNGKQVLDLGAFR